ncbi:hypothetical protein Sru01_16550 [Sphaerisporangium rufum]|uniref:Uncharacterized protein n=1 Tax=Sphaerisporangium rufum TaxID=1381558 RepID=A0A919R0D9_9ACTN|nr:GTPase domain-containing protein [Sphaerisporangium rufum]GII76673.1 hypothetical protein Sru01_16550 [Sphaerisporangium rufum]
MYGILAAAVVAGAGAIGTALFVRKVRRPMKIIVLGQALTGKTTLLNTWMGNWSANFPRTSLNPETVRTIKVETGEKTLLVNKKFIFRNGVDISGRDETMFNFRTDVKAAKAIIYLVDANHLYAEERRPPEHGHADEWVRIIDDGYRIKRYGREADRVVLVVTHTDQDPRHASLGPEEYQAQVWQQLKEVIDAIGAPGRTRVVAGSLATRPAAEELAESVVRSLL